VNFNDIRNGITLRRDFRILFEQFCWTVKVVEQDKEGDTVYEVVDMNPRQDSIMAPYRNCTLRLNHQEKRFLPWVTFMQWHYFTAHKMVKGSDTRSSSSLARLSQGHSVQNTEDDHPVTDRVKDYLQSIEIYEPEPVLLDHPDICA
jgi:hypothetical protein